MVAIDCNAEMLALESIKGIRRTQDPNDIGKIRRTPGVMGGIPAIAGTSIMLEFV
jgi:hypothetical protein